MRKPDNIVWSLLIVLLAWTGVFMGACAFDAYHKGDLDATSVLLGVIALCIANIILVYREIRND